MISIIDYGMGNLYSIKNAFEKVGTGAKIVTESKDLRKTDAIVIPGVGAFDEAMKNISPIQDDILDIVNSGIPFMGICLGMQLLFDGSEEGKSKGLGLIPGRVVKLPKKVLIPQIGWNELQIKKRIGLLEGISEGDFFYFVHSYHCLPKDRTVIAATADYGTDVTAVVAVDNIFGLQFHPEKSGTKGLRVLENFAKGVKC